VYTGNCQFASLSDQLYRTPKMQGVVRRLVVQQLTDNPDYYARFVPGDYKFYCWKMSQNHVWGDHLTLQAAADRYGIQISLITSYKDAPYMHIMPREIKSCRILWLSFFGTRVLCSAVRAGSLTLRGVHTRRAALQFAVH
jgi:hypothetical protein